VSKLWQRFVRWLAKEQIAYLEYENRELRYEGERWRHRYEGAMNAVRVFERQHRWLTDTVTDAEMLRPPAPIIIERPTKEVK
jgi:hypothetical protein